MNALMENLVPTISVIVTILLVGLALASLMRSALARLEGRLEGRLVAVENRLIAVERETARLGGLLEGLGLVGRAKTPGKV